MFATQMCGPCVQAIFREPEHKVRFFTILHTPKPDTGSEATWSQLSARGLTRSAATTAASFLAAPMSWDRRQPHRKCLRCHVYLSVCACMHSCKYVGFGRMYIFM